LPPRPPNPRAAAPPQTDTVEAKNVVTEERTKLEAIVGKYKLTPADLDGAWL
jgi:hypothetical protein